MIAIALATILVLAVIAYITKKNKASVVSDIAVRLAVDGSETAGAIERTAQSLMVENTMPECVEYGQEFDLNLEAVGIGMPYTGYYYGKLTVGATTRLYKEYFPKEAVFNSYQVIIAVPEGVNTEEYLISSGWKMLSDEYNFSLFILEPENQSWRDVQIEMEYVEKAYSMKTTVTNSACSYLVGFDNGGQALQQYIMKDSLAVASAVFINASNIKSDYLSSLKNEFYENNESDKMIHFNDVPVPIWIIDKSMEGEVGEVIQYWKDVNDADGEAERFLDGEIYYQNEEKAAINHFTPAGAVASVVVSNTQDVMCEKFSRTLYTEFLSLTNRYGNTAWSNEVYPRLDLDERYGLKEYSFIDQGVLRQYSVYVPEGYAPNQAYPIVYTLPGGDQTHRMHMEISRWSVVANAHGFIVVSVSGATGLDHMKVFGMGHTKVTGEAITKYLAFNDTGDNEAEGYINDVAFFKELMFRVESEYKVDETRRYLSSHSNGSVFTANMLVELGDRFAAYSRYSGSNLVDSDVPLYPVIGENNRPVIAWDGSALSKDFADSFKSYLTETWAYNEEAAADIMENPTVNGEEKAIGNGIIQKTWEWQTSKGFPIFRTTTVSYRGHSFLVWDTPIQAEWFAHWTRVNGQICYDGMPVEK